MSIGVLIITHPGIGSSMKHTASRILGQAPCATKCLDVPPDAALPSIEEKAQCMISELDSGDGVVILTDIFGATPHNVAQRVATENCRVVSGLNLPMLIRVYNYSQQNLDEVAEKAVDGAQRSILVS